MSEITKLWGPFRTTFNQFRYPYGTLDLISVSWPFIAMLQDGSVVHYSLTFDVAKNKLTAHRHQSTIDAIIKNRRNASADDQVLQAAYERILAEEVAKAEPTKLWEPNPMPRPMRGTVTEILKARVPPDELAKVTAQVIRRRR